MSEATTHAAPAETDSDGDGRMPKPIFVVGSSGSGTTLLRLILDSHPNICIGPETAFMRLVKAHRWIPYWRHGDRWWEGLGLSETELDQGLRDLYGGFFERVARRQGKKRWGEKTPMHVWHMDEISRLFDDAVFVGTVRHPAATIASTVTRFRFSVGLATNTWLRMNRALVYHGTSLHNRLGLVRYEDLVADPEGVLREVLDYLQEPWSPQVLEHHRVQREKGAPAVVDGRTRTGDAIDRTRASKWMTALTARDRRRVRRKTAAWAEFFGYDVDRPEPVAPFTPESSPRRYLLTSAELAERRETWPGKLDFRMPEPPRRDQILRKAPPHLDRRRNVRRSQLDALKERLPPPVRARAGKLRRKLRRPPPRRPPERRA